MYRLSGEQGVAVLALLALIHELLAQENQLLSHAFDRWLEKHPRLVWAVVLVTVLHLLNVMPPKIDPYHRVGTKKKRNLNDRI